MYKIVFILLFVTGYFYPTYYSSTLLWPTEALGLKKPKQQCESIMNEMSFNLYSSVFINGPNKLS